MVNFIILNGVSSSGKTSIGKIIQNISDEPYILMGKDHFIEMRSRKHNFRDLLPAIVKSSFYSAASFLYQNNNVILDYVFSDFNNTETFEPSSYIDLIEEVLIFFKIKENVRLTLVKVTADIDILLEREILRENRSIGLVERQINLIHKSIDYDMEIDTSILSPIQNARRVLDFIGNERNST
ncbi:MAG: hypothetical protein GY756_03650 [bacterium]|nr:hypothetical protein [bacterium]